MAKPITHASMRPPEFTGGKARRLHVHARTGPALQ